MESIIWDERNWDPEVLRKRESSLGTIRKLTGGAYGVFKL